LQGRNAGWYLIDSARGRPTNLTRIPVGGSAAWYYVSGTNPSSMLKAHGSNLYCLNCRTDRSLSHHAVQRFLPDQPGVRRAPAILRRGIMRPLAPWP